MKKPHLPQRIRYRTLLYLKRNSSTILACFGAVGVVATAVSSATATPKAMQKLSKARAKKEGKIGKAEAMTIFVPAYLPSIALGVSTIMCIFSMNSLDKRHQAALISAYAMLNESYKEYRSKLIELHGKEADEEIRGAIVRECCNFHQIGIDIPDDKLVFIEPISGETIECYEKEIMDAEYHINRNFVLRGYAPLNEFFDFLGLPRTDYGEEIGWSCADGYEWIDFEHHLISRDDGGTPVYAITYVFEPDPDYLRE